MLLRVLSILIDSFCVCHHPERTEQKPRCCGTCYLFHLCYNCLLKTPPPFHTHRLGSCFLWRFLKEHSGADKEETEPHFIVPYSERGQTEFTTKSRQNLPPEPDI
uniref:Secreted protein n=1 Tax=Mus musculus TaxID=10090 RepID=Q3TYJ6_MOUSE|nr:unnamed protein product [Mus musculus]